MNIIFNSKEERDSYYNKIAFICPICKEKSMGIGHVYKEIRICDDCYCDITGMVKVSEAIGIC